MGRVTASLELPYPAERVFRAATHIPDLPRWLPEVASAELLDPPLALGSRVRLVLGPGGAGTQVVGEVRQLEVPSLLAIGGSGGPLGVEVRTRLHPVGPAATRIELELELSTPPLLGFIAREAERRIQAELPASLARFRAILDGEPA